MRGNGNGRPSRGEIDPAALALVARRGPEILACARRWSATYEDAEDAYQRGLEILLTKAPTTAEEELVPWLKTVVKHEAWALRRQRERAAPVTDDGEPAEPAQGAPPAHDQAERYERLRHGAEAMQRLKPAEVRCLLLRAEGYSYEQIAQRTGYSYTKVNRCLSEGRRAFFERLKGIEAGSECDRLAPQLSALADGEASADDLAALRPHLKSCLACRARLREYRAAPARVAALVPPALVVAGGAGTGDGPGFVRGLVESIVGATHDKAAALGERAHAAAELATGQKIAAVAASAAALAGGGAATVNQIERRKAEPERPTQAKPVKEELPAPTPTPPAPAPASSAEEPVPAPAVPATPAPPPPDPANEFAPGPADAQPAPPPAPTPAASGFAPSGSEGAGSGESGAEFGP